MTDLQLAILLDQFHRALVWALEEARGKLPPEAKTSGSGDAPALTIVYEAVALIDDAAKQLQKAARR